jgi:hypothetical protein
MESRVCEHPPPLKKKGRRKRDGVCIGGDRRQESSSGWYGGERLGEWGWNDDDDIMDGELS